ncbi:MAG TPA: serine hydrolase [Thermoanaerobaculia bacterium]
MRRLLPLALLLLAACTTAAPPPATDLASSIDAILASVPAGHTVAVAFTDLETGATLERDAGVVMHAASTMKVPVMLTLFEAIDRGELRLDQPVPVRNSFRSIVDGSEFTLLREEDGDASLYDSVGQSLPLEELMRRMIVRSSNLGTNLLIELVGAPRVMDLMRRLGANDIRVLRGVEDEKAFEAGLNNVTTARDLMIVMNAIAEQKAVTPAASAAMVAILRAQEFREKIPAGVPPGVVVANKTGSITRISHDAAIVYPPGRAPYVLVVLTRGYQDGNDASKIIASISKAVWDSVAGPGR